MPYRAGAGGGAFGSSVYPDSRPKVDVGAAIDAISGGASSMIRAAYQRKLAQNQLQIEADQRKQATEQIAYQHQRDEVADKQHADEITYRRGRDASTDAEKALTDQRSAIERGFVPAHDEMQTQLRPSVASVGPVPAAPSAVRKAMTPPKQGAVQPLAQDPTTVGAMPKPGMASVAPAPPTSAPLPTNTPVATKTTVPETFDVQKGVRFQVAQERANEDAARQTAITARQMGLKKYGGEIAASLAKLRASLKEDAAKSATGRAMTGNKIEDGRQKAATGLLDHTNGSYDEAVAYLNSEDGAALREQGVKPQHLMYAHSQYATTTTNQAIRLQTAPLGPSADSSVAIVNQTRRLAGGGAAKAAEPAPTDTRAAAPVTPVKQAPAAPAKTVVAPPAKKTPLGVEAKKRAQTDTAFATFLKGKGYSSADWKP